MPLKVLTFIGRQIRFKFLFLTPMGRLLAIDYGSKRTGIAVTVRFKLLTLK